MGASKCGPLSTSLAPAIADEKATPQALAWYIGTTGRMVDRAEMLKPLVVQVAIAWSTFERWL